jgi:hypothetical protein
MRIRFQIWIGIQIQGFDEKENLKLNFFKIKNCNLVIPYKGRLKLQQKPSLLTREHLALQNMKFLDFFLFLWVFFALLGPDPYPADQNQCGFMRTRIRTLNERESVLGFGIS